eukprot:CAMPEP_0183321534 /NCGR_PEP_ID=MMETSP0160_2-20130417/69097_1 /TAXON_ID=2839 ORGANISM="Odontella Sinensis, Strain Grunow 1884" /NCGR_SAMPLE_ID=MMETSP0160_2 /ASSEMBLY_ACC=CAM_ASM_000250 /LENGTH=185 /DNA_ID=CAMNT_0025488489 /DNA_START=44 /DNA_END=601 /DNA_ORIENTATION=-
MKLIILAKIFCRIGYGAWNVRWPPMLRLSPRTSLFLLNKDASPALDRTQLDQRDMEERQQSLVPEAVVVQVNPKSIAHVHASFVHRAQVVHTANIAAVAIHFWVVPKAVCKQKAHAAAIAEEVQVSGDAVVPDTQPCQILKPPKAMWQRPVELVDAHQRLLQFRQSRNRFGDLSLQPVPVDVHLP